MLQDIYLLHNCLYYIHVMLILTHLCWYSFSLIYFVKITFALDSRCLKTSKSTPSSSFYTVYYQRYSEFKTFGDRWRPSWFSPRKSGRKKWKQFFFSPFISQKSQLFKIYMKKSQNVSLLHNSVYYRSQRRKRSNRHVYRGKNHAYRGNTTATKVNPRLQR